MSPLSAEIKLFIEIAFLNAYCWTLMPAVGMFHSITFLPFFQKPERMLIIANNNSNEKLRFLTMRSYCPFCIKITLFFTWMGDTISNEQVTGHCIELRTRMTKGKIWCWIVYRDFLQSASCPILLMKYNMIHLFFGLGFLIYIYYIIYVYIYIYIYIHIFILNFQIIHKIIQAQIYILQKSTLLDIKMIL